MQIESIPSLAEVTPLLGECGLPVADLDPGAPPRFFGIRREDGLAGVVGLECQPRVALLRSLAVRPAFRGLGLGRALVGYAESFAAAQGIDTLFLLTTSAEPFFLALGYAATPRDAAPPAIRATRQFAALCPASAALLSKRLCHPRPLRDDDVAAVRQAAEAGFAAGLFCAESVVLALARAQGVESDLLPKAATAFCSGMARSCGTCGALTGAMMGVGLALGRAHPADSVQPSYAATQRLIAEFEREFGSRDCHVLLDGCDLNSAEGQAMFKAQGLGQRCRRFTATAAEFAARLIVEQQGETHDRPM